MTGASDGGSRAVGATTYSGLAFVASRAADSAFAFASASLASEGSGSPSSAVLGEGELEAINLQHLASY